MKLATRLIPFFALMVMLTFDLSAQREERMDEEKTSRADKFYFSHGGEMIFSWSQTEHPTSSEGVVLRWSPVFNFQTHANYDLGSAFGLMAGVAIRNIGYIYQFNDVDGRSFRKKFRTYNLGIPLGIKVGNMEKFFIYAGYEFEFPFHYKEKTFDDDRSKINKFSTWFSNRVNQVQQSAFVGFQTKYGINLKFKYYITEFHNQDFTQSTEDLFPPSGNPNVPYTGLKSNIFYVSITTMIDKRQKQYYSPWDWD